MDCAATAEVPMPRNGSNKRVASPLPWMRMHCSTRPMGKVAGCGRSWSRDWMVS